MTSLCGHSHAESCNTDASDTDFSSNDNHGPLHKCGSAIVSFVLPQIEIQLNSPKFVTFKNASSQFFISEPSLEGPFQPPRLT